MADSSSSSQAPTFDVNSIFSSLQNGVTAINGLAQILNTITSTSSTGVVTIHLTQVSS